MKYFTFVANVGYSGPNSSRHYTIEKKICTKDLPFVNDSYYAFCAEYTSEQKEFLKKVLGEEFDSFAKNFKSFQFKENVYLEI